MFAAASNFVFSLAKPASLGALTGVGIDIVEGDNRKRRPLFFAGSFAACHVLVTRVLPETVAGIASSLVMPAAYGALTGLGLEIFTGYIPNHIVNSKPLRGAAVFAVVSSLWNSSRPEMGAGAIGGLVIRRVAKEITALIKGQRQNPEDANELAGESKAMAIGACVAAIAGFGVRIALAKD